MIDAIGHFGYALLIGGHVAIAHDKRWGWPLRLVGELIWVALGVALGLSSVWLWGAVFCGIDAYAWWRRG